jgi:hypothetical protein
MITRIKDDQYLNIFEKTWLIATAEFIIAMSFLKLYDIETDEWHTRRIVWAMLAVAIILLILAGGVFGVAASIKYLV